MSGETHCLSTVMPGFMPGIHVFTEQPKSKWRRGWPGTSPAMTVEDPRLTISLGPGQARPCRVNATMPGFMPGIHVFTEQPKSKDVDGRDKPGHDG